MDNADTSNVIQIGDFRIARKAERYWPGKRGLQNGDCLHKNMTFDDHGNIVTCDDCNKQIDLAWAFQYIFNDYLREFEKLRAKERELQERTSKSIVLIAARRVEDAWRKHDTVPCCPHCSRGILATDHFGATHISKRMEMLRREREKQNR
jgi:transcriptional antiterminator Rof (Rho-off)